MSDPLYHIGDLNRAALDSTAEILGLGGAGAWIIHGRQVVEYPGRADLRLMIVVVERLDEGLEHVESN